MCLIIEQLHEVTEDIGELIEQWDVTLRTLYTPGQLHSYGVEQMLGPNKVFLLARLAGEAAGCGGIHLQGQLAELKRMYVRPQMRRQQVGRRLLEHLEQVARDRGIRHLVLETGDVLVPAIRLYETAGFTRCGPFGAYRTMPPTAIERSVFMEKWLD